MLAHNQLNAVRQMHFQTGPPISDHGLSSYSFFVIFFEGFSSVVVSAGIQTPTVMKLAPQESTS
jgi:hypothetical protein